jgi:putative addiction module component (TIGR02574 family)
MTLPALLAEIQSMTIEDRIRLAQAILDTIMEDQNPGDLTPPQKEELDRRIADMEANPENVLTWDQIKAHVRREKP